MKTLLIILTLHISALSIAQNHKFKAQLFINDTSLVSGGVIIFPLTKDTLKIDNSDTATIDLNNSRHWLFYFLWSGWKSRIFRFDTNSTTSDIQKVNVPDTVFFRHFEEERICPICLTSKHIIPIVYGMPTKKMMKQAKRGEFLLAGCMFYDYSPKYHCKRDDFEF